MAKKTPPKKMPDKGAPPNTSFQGKDQPDSASYPTTKKSVKHAVKGEGSTYMAPPRQPTTPGGIPTDPGTGFSEPSIRKVNEVPLRKPLTDTNPTGTAGSGDNPIGSYGGKK